MKLYSRSAFWQIKKPFRMQYGLHFERVFLDHITISGGRSYLISRLLYSFVVKYSRTTTVIMPTISARSIQPSSLRFVR